MFSTGQIKFYKQKMKNLYKIVFVQKEGLVDKWWHRLASVFIFGSTVAILVVYLFLFFSDEINWKKNIYTAYSFESNYDKAKGEEQNCSFVTLSSGFISIVCGDIFNASDFLTRHSKAKGTYEELQQLKTDKNIDEEKILRGGIKNGDFNNIKVKKDTIVLYKDLFIFLSLLLLILFFWFVFWESIIYRTIIYIIYGRKK